MNSEFQRIARRDKINAKKQENRMGKTRDLFKKLEISRELSGKDGFDKGQKWYGPNRSRRY